MEERIEQKDIIILVLFIICTLSILTACFLAHERDSIYKLCNDNCKQLMKDNYCIVDVDDYNIVDYDFLGDINETN